MYTMLPEEVREQEVYSVEQLIAQGKRQMFIISDQWITTKTFWYLLLQKASWILLIFPLFLSNKYLKKSIFIIMCCGVFGMIDHWVTYNGDWFGVVGFNYDVTFGVTLFILGVIESFKNGI